MARSKASIQMRYLTHFSDDLKSYRAKVRSKSDEVSEFPQQIDKIIHISERTSRGAVFINVELANSR